MICRVDNSAYINKISHAITCCVAKPSQSSQFVGENSANRVQIDAGSDNLRKILSTALSTGDCKISDAITQKTVCACLCAHPIRNIKTANAGFGTGNGFKKYISSAHDLRFYRRNNCFSRAGSDVAIYRRPGNRAYTPADPQSENAGQGH